MNKKPEKDKFIDGINKIIKRHNIERFRMEFRLDTKGNFSVYGLEQSHFIIKKGNKKIVFYFNDYIVSKNAVVEATDSFKNDIKVFFKEKEYPFEDGEIVKAIFDNSKKAYYY
jgi:hypothetical protein